MYVPVAAPGSSSLHSNVEPASVDVNVYDGAVTFVGPDGPPLICVCGVFGPGGLGSGGSPWKRASTKSVPPSTPAAVPTATNLPSACRTTSTSTSSPPASAASVFCLPSSEKVPSSVPSVLKRASANALPAFPMVTILPLPSSTTP